MQTSYDALSQGSSRMRLKECITDFCRGDTRGRDFLATKRISKTKPETCARNIMMSHLGIVAKGFPEGKFLFK